MKNEEATSRVETLFGQLVEALQAGKSEALRAYLDTAAQFTRYSFNNVCLIFAQRPEATRVAGYQTWKQLGRQVRKGERGLLIIAPIVRRSREDEDQEAGRQLVGFRASYVFDVSQTDGPDLPQLDGLPSGDAADYLPAMRSAIADAGIQLEYSRALPPATLGESRGGRIVIAGGLAPVDDFAALAHEFAHELLHKGNDRPTSRTVRETEAEAVAYIVCRAIGIQPGMPSADYIGMYGGDASTLLQSLERVQTTASQVLRNIGLDDASRTVAAA